MTDVVETTEEGLSASGVNSADDVRRHRTALVRYSSARRKLNLQLRKYLYRNLYYNPSVHEPNQRAVRMLRELFQYLIQHPEKVGGQTRKRARKDGWHRALCDYISGMTDRYCMHEHERLLGVATAATAD